MEAQSVIIPANYFVPVLIASAAVVFGAGGIFWQVRSFGNRLNKNDERWFEHFQGHAPGIAGGSNGDEK